MYYFPTRNDMLRAITKPGMVIGEIGVFKGEFATALLGLQPSKMVLIDPWDGFLTSGDCDGNNVAQIDGEAAFMMVKEKTKGMPCVEIRRGYSEKELMEFPDEFFDILYIDGDHSFEGCFKDLQLARRKVKRGGWICGHDYEMNELKARNVYCFGVNQAVDIFCIKNNLKVRALGLDGCVSYAIPNL